MKVADLLTDESKWCKYHDAKNKRGKSVSVWSEEACCWCLAGAMIRCYGIAEEPDTRLRTAIENRAGHRLLTQFNDDPERTFAEVRAVILEAGI